MSRMPGQSIYSNAQSFTVINYVLDGESIQSAIVPEIVNVPFEDASPVRSSSAYPGKRNYEGEYWSATLRRHIHFESLTERKFAMYADFRDEITSYAWQPFVLKWPKGTKGHRGHVPDYFCRLSNHEGLVVDVKRPDKVEASREQFDMTRDVCDQIGWKYEIFSELPPVYEQGMNFLAGFRYDRFSPEESIALHILEVFSPEIALGVGIQRAVKELRIDEPTIRGYVLHLLWHRVLTADLEVRLDDTSVVACEEMQ